MAIIYPLNFPSNVGVTRLQFLPRNVVASHKSAFTGQTQTQQHQGQWWEVVADFPIMERAKGEAMVSFLTSLKGMVGTFLFGDLINAIPRGVATGTPVVSGAGQTGESLNTSGWTVSTGGVLLKGDWLQLGSGVTSKLYKVQEDVDSDPSGNAPVTLWPEIRTAPADSATITVNNTQGVFRLMSNEDVWTVDMLGHYKIAFSAMEAL